MLEGSVSISCLAWGFNPWAALRSTLAKLAAAVRYKRQQGSFVSGSSLPAAGGRDETACGAVVPPASSDTAASGAAGKLAGSVKQPTAIHIDVIGYAGDSYWGVEMLAQDVPA